MKTKTARCSQVLWIAVTIGFALGILLAMPGTAAAQGPWVVSPSPTPTNNIYYNAGNVGIGTNAPDQKLVVSANSASTLPAANGMIHLFGADGVQTLITNDGFAAAPVFLLRRANTSAASPSAVQANDFMGAVGVAGYGSTGYQGTRARVGFFASETWTNSANGTYIAFNTTANGAATGGGTERVRIDNAGNVGIGTPSPTYKLHVNGEVNATGLNINGSPVTSSQWTTSGSNINYATAGNVGIGSPSPGYRLDVQGGQVNASAGLCIGGDCKTAWSQVGGSQWTTSGSNVYYNSGNVGIGTTSPGAKLAVTANTQTNASFTITPDGTNNYYAGNNHDALLVDGSLTGPHGGYTSGTVRLFRIRSLTGADSLVVGKAGDVVVTPNTNYAASALKLSPDGTNSFYAGSDYDVLQIVGSGLTSHGTYTGKTVRLIHVTNATGGDAFVIARDGNATFGGNVTVAGNINAKYQDVAEWVESSQLLAAGTVVVLDQTKSNQVVASSQAYDTRVAGVISTQPGITLGEKGESKVLVATTGRVKLRVDATDRPIQVGDLLVTSDIEGVAKKSEPLMLGGVPIHRPGTLIGKALEPLAKGRGEILVLLSLQ